MIFYPLYEDIRTQKISMLPALLLIAIGILADIFNGNGDIRQWLYGAVPGLILFISSRLFGRYIGEGDCFLMIGLGVLEGIIFCGKMLMVSGAVVFFFSVALMAAGRLKRTSKVPFVPFLVVGYLGAWFI
jgi:prepilin signal peptidase PulO-like enzyme (type II secretory pathway)